MADTLNSEKATACDAAAAQAGRAPGAFTKQLSPAGSASGYDVVSELPKVLPVSRREIDVMFWNCRDLIEELLAPDEH